MAESFIGNLFEFLIGLFVIGFIINILSGIILMIGLPYLGLPTENDFLVSYQIGLYLIKVIVLLGLFTTKKTIAYGYLINIIFESIIDKFFN